MLDRFSPLKITDHYTTQNRLVIPPMASSTADEGGRVTEKTLSHYKNLCQVGAGIVFVEYSHVNLEGRNTQFQLGASHQDQVSGLSKLASLIKDSNALAIQQLAYAGGKNTLETKEARLLAPSDVAVPSKEVQFREPVPMSSEQVEDLMNDYVGAAQRALCAGFHGVELHLAHGYGLNQWISPVTNKRRDDFGGSRMNRLRIVLMIVEKIRSLSPHFLVSCRIPGQDFIEGGLTNSDMQKNAQDLVGAGVNLINVSSGLGGWRRPGGRDHEGYLVPEATCILETVDVPVIGVGGIKTGAYIDLALRQKSFSLAAVGRAILEDPEKWRNSQFYR